MGSAHIAILDNNITVAAAANVTLSIEATRGGPATVNLFAVPNPADCGLPPAGGGCAVVADMLYQVSGLVFLPANSKPSATARPTSCVR